MKGKREGRGERKTENVFECQEMLGGVSFGRVVREALARSPAR